MFDEEKCENWLVLPHLWRFYVYEAAHWCSIWRVYQLFHWNNLIPLRQSIWFVPLQNNRQLMFAKFELLSPVERDSVIMSQQRQHFVWIVMLDQRLTTIDEHISVNPMYSEKPYEFLLLTLQNRFGKGNRNQLTSL